LIRVSEGSLDRRTSVKRQQLGPEAEAHDTFDQLKSMEYDPAWWELAFTTDDRLAGLVMPTRVPSAATIGYIGVAQEMLLLLRKETTYSRQSPRKSVASLSWEYIGSGITFNCRSSGARTDHYFGLTFSFCSG